MGCGYSKKTPERGKAPMQLHTFHQVRLQEMRKCGDPAILQGDLPTKMSLYESAKKEDSISLPQVNDHSRHESFQASAKVVGAKTDARIPIEKTFKVVSVAYSDNESSEKPDTYEDEMQMNKATTGLHDKDGYVKIQLEMIEDKEDADRLSNVKSPSNEGETAKETLDSTVKTFDADNTKQQTQELTGSNANEQQEFKTEEEDYDNGDDNDDSDHGRSMSQTEGDLSSGPLSFKVYCVPPSQEIEEEEDESDDVLQVNDDSDGYIAHQRRISCDSYGSVLSVSSWSSKEVVATNVKKRRRRKKFGKALMGGPVAMRSLLICNAENYTRHRTGHGRGRIMAAGAAH